MGHGGDRPQAGRGSRHPSHHDAAALQCRGAGAARGSERGGPIPKPLPCPSHPGRLGCSGSRSPALLGTPGNPALQETPDLATLVGIPALFQDSSPPQDPHPCGGPSAPQNPAVLQGPPALWEPHSSAGPLPPGDPTAVWGIPARLGSQTPFGTPQLSWKPQPTWGPCLSPRDPTPPGDLSPLWGPQSPPRDPTALPGRADTGDTHSATIGAVTFFFGFHLQEKAAHVQGLSCPHRRPHCRPHCPWAKPGGIGSGCKCKAGYGHRGHPTAAMTPSPMLTGFL